jgi:hypothetical protein
MRNLKEIERHPLLHAIKGRGIEGLRAFIFLVIAVSSSPVFAQVDRSAYRYSTLDEVIAKHRLRLGTSEISDKDTVLIAPEYKYRLRLTVTVRIQEVTPDAAAALLAWSQTHPDLPAFLKEYTHEVEVAGNDKPVWLIWQRSLVVPFKVERSSGGGIEAYAILAGAFHGRLLLFVTAYESLR